MDSAKGIAMMGDSGKTIDELEKILFDLDPHVATPWHTFPMICIPTTFGTGSEVIRNAVISDPTGHKLVPMHDCILPAYAIEDPDLMATLPAHVAAATAMDALVQAIESYVSRAATEFSELCALHAIELIGPNIVRYVRNPAEEGPADAVCRGAMFAGVMAYQAAYTLPALPPYEWLSRDSFRIMTPFAGQRAAFKEHSVPLPGAVMRRAPVNVKYECAVFTHHSSP